MSLGYDKHDKESILTYAKKMIGKSIKQAVAVSDSLAIYDEEKDKQKKGRFGLMLETIYFGVKPNNRPEPDFPEAGLELKATPLKMIRGDKYVSKERIVLGVIDYVTLPGQSFESSDFWRKNNLILLFFYLYEKNILPIDYIVKLVDIWSLNDTDLRVIKNDWEIIRSKVSEGLAHKLSESDTLYLGACTKGANSSTVRGQPRSPIKAKQRAFSFKQSYVNYMISELARRNGISNPGKYGRVLTDNDVINNVKIEDLVEKKFKPYIGQSLKSLSKEFGKDLNIKSKNFTSILINKILGIELGVKIEEFEKAGIVVKVSRVNKEGMPKEDVSFPTFKYKSFNGINWQDSDFKEDLEKPFLFVFFKENGSDFILQKVVFWRMPSDHFKKAREVWVRTKWLVTHGKIVKSMKNGKRRTRFPDVKNEVAHVRPHARNANDCYQLPISDQVTKTDFYTKHSFWLNKSYVKNEIYQ